MRSNRALLAPLALILATMPTLAGGQDRRSPSDNYARFDEAAPQIDIWLDQFSFVSGQRIRAFFDSDNGAYVTIVRISTDGRLYVLYPGRPDRQRRYNANGRDSYEVPLTTDAGYYLDEPPGTGFIFAIASFDPFDYSKYAWNSSWREPRLTSTIADPFALVNRFVSQTLDVRSMYAFDYEQYQVVSGGRYAGRYGYGNRFYGDDAYYRCLYAFGVYGDNYCRSYGIVYGTPVVIGRTIPSSKPTGTAKGMKVKPLVVDPMLPVPEHLTPPPTNDRTGSARPSGKTWESMRREDAPRINPRVREYEPSVRSEPVQSQRSEPRIAPRAPSEEPRVIRAPSHYDVPRVEHRVDQPRVEQPRVEQRHVEQPRVEQPRVEHPRIEQPRVEQRQVEHPSPKSVPVKDQN